MNSLRQRRQARRPTVEGLEARAMMSVTPVTSVINNLPAAPQLRVSTVPANGDLNPYGVAFVPRGFPTNSPIHYGDVLVANFNAAGNLQGTGTTIVDVTPQGRVTTFYQGPKGLGLTTALGILKSGYVIVGNLPTTDGTSATVGQGSLVVLDRFGHLVGTVSDPNLLNGPWDLTIDDRGSHASIFVSNVLSGTITRIDIAADHRGVRSHTTQIASGFAHRTDPAALVVGPAGLAYDRVHDVLYVASTLDNAIFAVPNAERSRVDRGRGALIVQDNVHLHGPLGLTLASNGNLIAANSDAVNADPNQQSEIVEYTRGGRFVAQFSLLATMPAAPFGIAIQASPRGLVSFAAVNDDTNQLEVFRFQVPRR